MVLGMGLKGEANNSKGVFLKSGLNEHNIYLGMILFINSCINMDEIIKNKENKQIKNQLQLIAGGLILVAIFILLIQFLFWVLGYQFNNQELFISLFIGAYLFFYGSSIGLLANRNPEVGSYFGFAGLGLFGLIFLLIILINPDNKSLDLEWTISIILAICLFIFYIGISIVSYLRWLKKKKTSNRSEQGVDEVEGQHKSGREG